MDNISTQNKGARLKKGWRKAMASIRESDSKSFRSYLKIKDGKLKFWVGEGKLYFWIFMIAIIILMSVITSINRRLNQNIERPHNEVINSTRLEDR